MSRQSNKRVVAIIRPPLIAIGFVAKTLYKLLFGWLDVPLARKRQDKFAREIQAELPFLFNEYRGKLIPVENGRLPLPFDYVGATVDIGCFLLSFARGRGELGITISAKNADGSSNLSDLLDAMQDPYDVRRKVVYSLADWALLLKPNMPSLREVFSAGKYRHTREYVREFKKRMSTSDDC
ncbi:MAG TPA: hypothetical protein VGK24_11120 [Candidatus Angelobacter sp.]|jgi:hypothetical protein